MYARLHAASVELVRRAPVSSKVFGPPRGVITSTKQWVEEYCRAGRAASDECWYKSISAEGFRGEFSAHPDPRTLPSLDTPFLGHDRQRLLETFVACIPRARVVTRTGIVISPDDRVFRQSCVFYEPVFYSDIEYNTLRPMLRPDKLPGGYLVMASRQHTNYFHWLTECVTRLCAVDASCDAPVLLPRGLSSWQAESLELLGIPRGRMLQLEEGCYEVDRLYFPFVGTTGNIATWALQELRRRYCGDRPVRRGKRLYAGRTDAAYRRVVNEDEVVRSLEREGFSVVEGSRLSFAEQVELYADAEIVVGIHGAGLTNFMFAPPQAVIIEALDPEHNNPCYYLLSASLDQRYWCFYGENQSVRRGQPVKKGYDDIAVPVDTLMRTLDAALAESNVGERERDFSTESRAADAGGAA
jgi:capsular polysaccharide biosynthesis protein